MVPCIPKSFSIQHTQIEMTVIELVEDTEEEWKSSSSPSSRR